MQKRSGLAGAAMIALIGSAVVMTASGSAGAAPPSGSTLRFNATYVNGVQQDAAPTGDSIGDRDIDLFHLTTPGGRDAGDATSECVLIRAGDTSPLAQCSATLALTDGTLELGGITTGAPDTTYAILGGTGRYTASNGTVDFQPNPSGITVTVTLTR